MIGFTGHRVIADEEACRLLLLELLRKERQRACGDTYAVSSLAAGGDLLFAESCRALGIPLKVLLPMPMEDFREDFDEATWLRVLDCLHAALEVRTTGQSSNRPACYYDCGIETVRQSDILIALWDGKPSRGFGGTADIVEFARKVQHPALWLNPGTLQVCPLQQEPAPSDLEPDLELQFLNQLPDLIAVGTTNEPTEVALAWHHKLDANANRVAPQARRRASIPIVCTAIAALLTAGSTYVHASRLCLIAGAALGIAARYLPRLLQTGQQQELWARTRLPAEVTRSVMALWLTPPEHELPSRGMFPELDAMLRSLEILKLRSSSRGMGNLSADERLLAFKETYLRERIDGQLAYFRRHAALADRDTRTFKHVAAIATSFGTLISVVLVIAKTPSHRYLGESLTASMSMLTTIVFQMAAIAGALLAVRDSERRSRRYHEIAAALQLWRSSFDATRTWPRLLELTTKIERALLAELLEWKVLMKHRKIARS